MDAEAAFNDSTNNELKCNRLTSDIAVLREMSSVADDRQSGTELTNSQIVRMAADCGMAENQVTSIQRMDPMKIEETDYQREDIAIDFRSVTMQELIQFGLTAELARGASKVTQIRLNHQPALPSAAKASLAGTKARETWNANLILTQLVFAATRTTE
ncbi:hypothetical protein [Rubripirellula lacrimiformis]|nr:hypothetical protein [Rubripirellula lacrimiformis]